MMKIVFEFQTPYGVFRDALHLPEDHGLSQEQITAMQQERLDNWLFAVENPPEAVSEDDA
jgi:MOSC domain-containing protein YiiM